MTNVHSPRSGIAGRLVRPAPAAQRVADALREEILAGGVRPGEQLVEESLAASLGVSRNTVREAYALLAGERIVDRLPARGVFVARPGPDQVRDVYRARAMVEASALQWGLPASEEQLDGLEACVRSGRLHRVDGDWAQVAQANHDFHRRVVDLTGSSRVIAWFSGLLAELRLAFHQISDVTFHGPYVDDNASVVELLRAGRRDDAALHILDYLARAEQDVLARLT